MAKQHRASPPNDYKSCRATFSARTELSAEMPAALPTTAMVMERSGLSRRAVQVHTVHLTAYGLQDGVPTGVPLDTPLPDTADALDTEDPLTPLQWAASIPLPQSCRTCRCILCELAKISRGDWLGQISVRDLATRLEMSEWTVRMHLRTGHTVQRIGHSLAAAGIVAFDAVAEITGYNEQTRKPLITRRADRFILAPEKRKLGVYGLPYTGDVRSDQLMERLRDETEWFDPTHKEAVWIINLMIALIRNGWPEDLLVTKLRERPHRGAAALKRPYRYASVRLPKKSDTFTRSAFAGPGTGFDKPRCPVCQGRILGKSEDGRHEIYRREHDGEEQRTTAAPHQLAGAR
ncbi:hypothetical protein [Streptomyces sp. NPDC087300]|uniref:hypothetical protein n=1 Tax=Streptomyces sp. NPDC087300 TaxID=3365780 RepID=UPI0038043A1D